MHETLRLRHFAGSAGAIFAGFVVVVALSIATDMTLYATGVFPRRGLRMADALFLLATLYRTVYGLAGSYITARLAPYRPMQHALLGGLIGLVISTAGAVATWNRGPAFGPLWYPLALFVLAMPTAWAGGRLFVSTARSRG